MFGFGSRRSPSVRPRWAQIGRRMAGSSTSALPQRRHRRDSQWPFNVDSGRSFWGCATSPSEICRRKCLLRRRLRGGGADECVKDWSAAPQSFPALKRAPSSRCPRRRRTGCCRRRKCVIRSPLEGGQEPGRTAERRSGNQLTAIPPWRRARRRGLGCCHLLSSAPRCCGRVWYPA
jgi:hypothetical protein